MGKSWQEWNHFWVCSGLYIVYLWYAIFVDKLTNNIKDQVHNTQSECVNLVGKAPNRI